MRKSRVFFKMSDIIFHYPRNYKKYPDIKIEKNLVYDDRYGDFTKGDIYYNPSKKQGKYPVFINVHGGGFVRGDKRHRSTFCSNVAENGWFVFNINYRLAPAHLLPSGTEDTLNAMNYLLTLEKKYDLDLDKIVISGDSAGAYYAAAAVASTTDETLRKNLKLPVYKGKIAALVSFCGIFDLISVMCSKSPLGMAKDIAECLLGFTIKEDNSNLSDCAFLDYISVLNFVNNKWPKTYVITAINDSFCGGQGEKLVEKLQEAGAEVEHYNANKYGEMHCFHLLPYLKSTKACLKETFVFLEKIKSVTETKES